MFGLSVTVLVLSSLLSHSRAKSTIHYLHWNSTNPIFRIDNTDHIVDVNEGKCHILKVPIIAGTRVLGGDSIILWAI